MLQVVFQLLFFQPWLSESYESLFLAKDKKKLILPSMVVVVLERSKVVVVAGGDAFAMDVDDEPASVYEREVERCGSANVGTKE